MTPGEQVRQDADYWRDRALKAERERDEFEQACATAGEIIADLKAKLGVQAAVASIADDALLSRRRR